MANEERNNPGLIQEVDPSELGQLRPSPTPSSQERQSMIRERALGMVEKREQPAQSRHPELTFADTGTQDLSASARESAVLLDQNQLSSNVESKLESRGQDVSQEETNAPEQHRKQREEEATLEAQQEQQKDQNHER